MQGRRGTIGSMHETTECDLGSTSSDATVDQQNYWNNLWNLGENETPEYLLSPSDLIISSVSPISHEWQNSRGWSLGEPSSSNTANEINNNEQIRELGGSLSISVDGGGLASPRLEERCLEPTNFVSLDNVNTGSMYIGSSNSHSAFQNLNFVEGLVDSSRDNNQQQEHPNLHKSSGSVSECIPPDVVSSSSLRPSENNGLLVEDTTRRVSCKRKVVDGNAGQPSDGGSCSYSQHTDDTSAWSTLPAQDSTGSNLSRYFPSEQINSRLGLGMGNEAINSASDSNVAGSSLSFPRNFHLRINPSNEQSSVPPTAFSTGSVIRHSGVSSSTLMPQSIHPVDNFLNLRSPPPLNLITPSQPLVVYVPPLPRNRQSFRWSSSTSSRLVRPSNSIISAGSDTLHHEEGSSRIISSNISEDHILNPSNDLRSLVQNPIFRASSSSSANLSILGNVASSFRIGSNSATDPSSASTQVSHSNPAQHPRRLSENLRRSLFSPGSYATGNPSNNHALLHSAPSASESRALSSGPRPISSSWLERQGDSDFAIPYSLQNLAEASEGSSRLVSELRNVMGLIRSRGGNLRHEDVLLLDQSVFSGRANIHDRHRSMRLDVDNMSYEELLALEERIGNVCTGLSEETILKLLKQKKYSVETRPQLDAEPCCVCLEDYGDDDDIAALDCGHDFHSNCIKQWLMQKNQCPICKATGLAT